MSTDPTTSNLDPTATPHALITGGEGDLARAIITELKHHHYLVEAPGKAHLNLADPASIHSYFANPQRPKITNLLICNAGITRDKPFFNTKAEEFSEVLKINLNGHATVARHLLRSMAKQRHGHIIFISSFAALSGTAGQSAYAAAKAALHGLAMSLAQEYGSRNIRVNIVLPGFLETKMTARLTQPQREAFRTSHTLHRFNDPQAVARFITFLDQHLPHTSGQLFNLDSRLHRWT